MSDAPFALAGSQSSDTSPTLVTKRLLLWMAIVLFGTAFYIIEHGTLPEEEDVFAEIVAGSRMRQVAFLSIGTFGCVLLGLRASHRLTFRDGLAILIVLFVVLCPASVMWTDDVRLTAKRGLIPVLCFLGIVGMCRHFRPRDICLITLVITSGYLAVGIGIEISSGLFSPFSFGYRFGGTLNPNSQGVNCACMSLAAASMARRGTRGRWLLSALFVVGFAFLLLTRSRTALGAFLFAGVVTWWLTASPQKRLIATVGGPTLLACMLFVVLYIGMEPEGTFLNTLLLGRDNSDAATLTGRIPLWNELLGYVGKRPLLGYGYGGFWNVERMLTLGSDLNWTAGHSHSGYLQMMLALGLFGTLTLLLALIIGLKRAVGRYVRTREAGYGFIVALLLMGAVHATLDITFVQPTFIAMMSACGLSMLAFQLDPGEATQESLA